MALLAAFVSVNTYTDPAVPDLTGAARDATALWALFSDSVEDLEARRLLDGEATGEKVREALDETLGAAGPDDTALFFFAGHRSPAHQLAPHDVRLDALADTTIPMDELTECLGASDARAVIVVLDCCFSGASLSRGGRGKESGPRPGWLTKPAYKSGKEGRITHMKYFSWSRWQKAGPGCCYGHPGPRVGHPTFGTTSLANFSTGAGSWATRGR